MSAISAPVEGPRTSRRSGGTEKRRACSRRTGEGAPSPHQSISRTASRPPDSRSGCTLVHWIRYFSCNRNGLSFTIPSDFQKKQAFQRARRFVGEKPIYARKADNQFGLSAGVSKNVVSEPAVFEPAMPRRPRLGRRRSRRLQRPRARAPLSEVARPSIRGAGDDHARPHSLARPLSVARSARRPRHRPARRRHCRGIHRHPVCRIWPEARRRSRNVHAEGPSGRASRPCPKPHFPSSPSRARP